VNKNDYFDNEAEDLVSGVGSNTKKVGNNLFSTFKNTPSIGFEQQIADGSKTIGGPQKRGRSPNMKD
jgi:hypothetical protein